MALSIVHLTKTYGAQRAVDDISFETVPGQITGFLGPNGAGKSTTMKIATGYLPFTDGEVRVCGLDVSQQPLEVKRITGYLPEHNPLYLDMYVREFLHFVARAYRLPNRNVRVEEMIDRIGLGRERNKKIGQLSKGYRQRVGLAQALIHDPQVLILDEPTTGLDPNQIVEIRQIIKDISKEKTVVLSTHIMQEVEAICDKVVIIDRGKIVADADVKSLKAGHATRQSFRVVFEREVDLSVFSMFETERVDGRTIVVRSGEPSLRQILLRVISEKELPLSSIAQADEQTLEEIFRKLTQSHVDDPH